MGASSSRTKYDGRVHHAYTGYSFRQYEAVPDKEKKRAAGCIYIVLEHDEIEYDFWRDVYVCTDFYTNNVVTFFQK